MRVSSVQSVWRHIRHGFVAVAAVTVIALSPSPAHADNYGSGIYGDGVYNSSSVPSSGGSSSGSSGGSSSGGSAAAASSSPTAESTVVETPSGLQVAINLSNGQVIPATGYYITITPLNGEGKSFDKAEIYLDGKLVYSGVPDGTGTLRWLWETASNPATKVKVVVFGPGSGTTTHEFDVTVAPAESSTTQTPTETNTPVATPTTDAAWPLWLILAVVGGLLVIVALILWIIARRRRNNDQLPPSNTFTPMQ